MCVYIQEAEKFPRVLLLKVILICDVTQYSMCFIFVQNCQSNPNRTDVGHVSHEFALSSGFRPLKSNNLKYNTMERWINGSIIPPLDGPMFILIEWE